MPTGTSPAPIVPQTLPTTHTPTPTQLAGMVRALSGQLRQVTGRTHHPGMLSRAIPAAMAWRAILLAQADAMLTAMETSTLDDALVVGIARDGCSQNEGVIRFDNFPAVASDDAGSGDVWVAAWVRVFGDEILAAAANDEAGAT